MEKDNRCPYCGKPAQFTRINIEVVRKDYETKRSLSAYEGEGLICGECGICFGSSGGGTFQTRLKAKKYRCPRCGKRRRLVRLQIRDFLEDDETHRSIYRSETDTVACEKCCNNIEIGRDIFNRIKNG